jgi:hypothetical protein
MFALYKNSVHAMLHLCCWSLAWHSRMILCWHDRALDGLVDADNREALTKEFQMAVEAAPRFSEVP